MHSFVRVRFLDNSCQLVAKLIFLMKEIFMYKSVRIYCPYKDFINQVELWKIRAVTLIKK